METDKKSDGNKICLRSSVVEPAAFNRKTKVRFFSGALYVFPQRKAHGNKSA